MAYTDVSTMKADVPKRTRVVSEQEQAKTDSRRMVRTAQHTSASSAVYSLQPILRAVVYSLQSTVIFHSRHSIDMHTMITLHCMSIGQVKGREYDQARSR